MTDCRFTFTIDSVPFDTDYRPADGTRITTNFANLARGTNREENLRNTLRMIDNRFNSLVERDNPHGDRYRIELAIISVGLRLQSRFGDESFPLMEMLQPGIIDRHTGERIAGIVGNNFSSYIRDYDFSIVLPDHLAQQPGTAPPADFGDLHGSLFRHFVASDIFRRTFAKPPVICLSVSSSGTYQRTTNRHTVLGAEYMNDQPSLTDAYFARMGLTPRYFMPSHAVAPLAFYHSGELASDYTSLELASTISVMETFQKIYRPEIYNANSVAAEMYRPSLTYQDYSLTRITYDREERSRLAVEQAHFARQHFIEPNAALLTQWQADCAS